MDDNSISRAELSVTGPYLVLPRRRVSDAASSNKHQPNPVACSSALKRLRNHRQQPQTHTDTHFLKRQKNTRVLEKHGLGVGVGVWWMGGRFAGHLGVWLGSLARGGQLLDDALSTVSAWQPGQR